MLSNSSIASLEYSNDLFIFCNVKSAKFSAWSPILSISFTMWNVAATIFFSLSYNSHLESLTKYVVIDSSNIFIIFSFS